MTIQRRLGNLVGPMLLSLAFCVYSQLTLIIVFRAVVKVALVVKRSKKAGDGTSRDPQEVTRDERVPAPTAILSLTPVSGPVRVASLMPLEDGQRSTSIQPFEVG